MNKFNPVETLKTQLNNSKPALYYNPDVDHEIWYQQAYNKLYQLLGMDYFTRVDANIQVEYDRKYSTYREIRFVMDVEVDCQMPCHLLLPNNVENPSLMICLQGHSSGMHLSMGRVKYQGDEESIEGGRDFALQAVNHNMAALCIEQRGFGERSMHPEKKGTECHIPTMTQLMMGRTMIGARVWDVMRAIDAVMEYFDSINYDNIYIMGNSGGGTVSYYSACIDTRIKMAVPGCAVCTYRESIASISHCVCNHIPGIMEHFEMGDLAGLIAPRILILPVGAKDLIFPIEGVKNVFNTIQQIYDKLDAHDSCRLIIGPNGHEFYADLAWSEINKYMGDSISL